MRGRNLGFARLSVSALRAERLHKIVHTAILPRCSHISRSDSLNVAATSKNHEARHQCALAGGSVDPNMCMKKSKWNFPNNGRRDAATALPSAI